MNPQTGEIQQFEGEEPAKQAGFTCPLGRPPRANCKECYGRGNIGKDAASGLYVPCLCTRPLSDFKTPMQRVMQRQGRQQWGGFRKR